MICLSNITRLTQSTDCNSTCQWQRCNPCSTLHYWHSVELLARWEKFGTAQRGMEFRSTVSWRMNFGFFFHFVLEDLKLYVKLYVVPLKDFFFLCIFLFFLIIFMSARHECDGWRDVFSMFSSIYYVSIYMQNLFLR